MIKWVVIVIGLLLPTSVFATEECTFKYRIESRSDIRICSDKELTKQSLIFIRDTVDEMPSQYYSFLKEKNINTSLPILGVVRLQVTENKNDIGKTVGNNKIVVGSFKEERFGRRSISISEMQILRKTQTLRHELAHLINSDIGISDPSSSESLAYAFEDYVARQ